MIQNPLQLPLIQTGKNGIVYEQDRLTEEIYDALTRWAVRHLEIKKAEEVYNQENKEQGDSEIRKGVYSTEISKPATLSASSSTSSTRNKHWKHIRQLSKTTSAGVKVKNFAHAIKGMTENQKARNALRKSLNSLEPTGPDIDDESSKWELSKVEVSNVRDIIMDTIGNDLYNQNTEEELKPSPSISTKS